MRHGKDFKRLWPALAILALSLPVLGEDKIVASQWAAAPVKIDGQSDDWAAEALNSDKKTSVDYAFRNDDKNLFVLVVFKDPRFLSSINLTGLTMWFNSETDKKKDYAITFLNRPLSADQYIALLEEKKGPISEEQKAQIRTNKLYMFYDHALINKKNEAAPAKFAEAQGFQIPVFRNGVLEKTAIYEVVVPLNRLAELSAEIGADPGKTVQVCFEWGGATRRMKDAVAAQIGSEGARARSEAATGSLTDERGERGLGDLERQSESLSAMRRRLPKQYSFWATVKLAQSQ
jgi:hypothetical protein